MAIKPHDQSAFAARLTPLLEGIADLEGARLPGMRRLNALARAEAEGLDVPKAYVKQAEALAQK